MAWSAPKTYTAGAVLTAAELNQYQRDNLLETSPATATTAGDIVYADAANSMGSRLALGAAGTLMVSDGTDPQWRTIKSVSGLPTATTTSTSYISFASWTGGSTISTTATTGTKALVFMTARVSNSTAGSSVFLGFEVSGATTLAFSDNRAGRYESSVANDVANPAVMEDVTLTAGSNTFTAGGRVDGNTGTATKIDMIVIPYA
jgi:hypothetical protein